MAAFATMQAAEARARVLMAGGKMSTYNIAVAHSGRTKAGVICVRVLRGMSLSPTRVGDGQLASKAGSWEELTDDAAT
jgi:hypothetical protein